MKVNRNSWHYRFLSFAREDPMPKNLCSYFWNIVFRIVLIPCISFFALGLAFLMAMPFLWTFFEDGGAIGIAIIGAIIDIMILAAIWVDERKKNRLYIYKPPGPLKQYLKARKEKVCPLIEYE